MVLNQFLNLEYHTTSSYFYICSKFFQVCMSQVLKMQNIKIRVHAFCTNPINTHFCAYSKKYWQALSKSNCFLLKPVKNFFILFFFFCLTKNSFFPQLINRTKDILFINLNHRVPTGSNAFFFFITCRCRRLSVRSYQTLLLCSWTTKIWLLLVFLQTAEYFSIQRLLTRKIY